MENKYRNIMPSPSEITPEKIYHSRRDFLKLLGIAAGSALLAACNIQPNDPGNSTPATEPQANTLFDEDGDPANSFGQITSYNNFYEFSLDKEAVARLSQNFQTSPWSLEISGLVHRPTTFSIEDLLKFEQKERIYRLRCVEAWSMVIPWIGFELGELLGNVEPMSSAKYVAFTTLYDTTQFPGQRNLTNYPWPYQEGLRLDEAFHPLTLLATGLYGQSMPNQNGAPIRLVVPWKYGFKSIKSIVKIELTEEQPPTLWSTIAPNEYGFYANVNPAVNHPRWSQASERRIGELSRRPTLMFNGYESEVGELYSGMDLNVQY